ncbi:MAG: SDR family NAD(P)-dependent oxidoreductase [Polyangiaceae bacterium]|jgi:short-subunit dehydrogenase|nr:SDR family NAD(P)-dependent oxidoreductase [Polyangiaceae bacterium]
MRGTAVVTGAGSGIGREITRELLRRGVSVVGVALGQAELDALERETAGSSATLCTLRLDLTEKDAAASVLREVDRRGLTVDTLVNCAGVGLYGEHLDLDDAAVDRMIALNVAALTSLSTAFARRMTRAGRGRILNVASTAAFQPLPRLCAYAATKHYVAAFTLGLAEELAGTGVIVSLLCPGITATPFIEGAGVGSGTPTDRLARRLAMSPEAVAVEAVDGLERGRGLVIAGRRNRAHYALTRALPERTFTRVFGRVTRAAG